MLESQQCASWGNLTLLESDDAHRAQHPLADFWGMHMVTRDWAEPGLGAHRIYPAASDALDGAGRQLVRVHAVRRPDGRLALLLLNLSPSQPFLARVTVRERGLTAPLAGPMQEYQLSSADWAWAPAGRRGHPALDAPPQQTTLADGHAQPLTLPPYSVTVVREITARGPANR
jgi:hypothetical protein